MSERPPTARPTTRLRELIGAPGPTLVVECLNPGTARVVEMAGVEVTYIGGHAAGGLNWALPDHGVVTLTEMVELTRRVVDSVTIPVIADADQGGETALNVRRTVQGFEGAGAAGIHLEDTLNPKKTYKEKSLTSIELMCARLTAAAEARTDPDFVLIARTDELMMGGTVDEAIKRGIAYADAGADVFMCCDTQLETIEQVAREVPIPVLDLNKPVDDWRGTPLGVNLFTGPGLMSAINAHRRMVEEILRTGKFDFDTNRVPLDYYRELTREDDWEPLAHRWVAATGR